MFLFNDIHIIYLFFPIAYPLGATLVQTPERHFRGSLQTAEGVSPSSLL